MTAGERHEGGCLCGAVRYVGRGAPNWVAHCHCQSCRRASGAVILTWAGFPGGNYEVTRGSPRFNGSSPGLRRSFCSACGTPLTFESERFPGEVRITVGSLDHPDALPAQGHVFTEEQIAWLHLDDDLPKHATTGSAT